MSAISTIIITKNEESHIRACLEAVLWTDEIIVLDCGSMGKTKNICQEYAPKVEFYETDWPGFGKQKNRALEFATSEWILSVDADEIVTPELKQEIQQVLINDNGFSGWQMPRLTYFYGRPIKYCFKNNNDAPIRLVKKSQGKFSDDIIHEKLIVNGKVGKLKSKLNHYSFSNLEELIRKINNYSTLGATKLYQKQKKTCVLKTLLHALWAFIKIYFLNFGFLDGWPGFLIAFSNFEGTFYKYSKLLEKQQKPMP